MSKKYKKRPSSKRLEKAPTQEHQKLKSTRAFFRGSAELTTWGQGYILSEESNKKLKQRLFKIRDRFRDRNSSTWSAMAKGKNW